MIVADSDALIDYLRNREPLASAVARHLEEANLATTAVNVFELRRGAPPGVPSSAKVSELLELLEIFPIELPDAERAGALAHALDRAGQAIGEADSLIAGVCLERGLPLLTRNRRHFERVPGLGLQEP